MSPADGVNPTLAQGLRAHEAGRLQEAEQAYLATLRESRDHPVALLYLGVLRYDTREFDEAIRLISRAIEADPRQHAAHNHMGLVLLARSEIDEGIRHFRKALELRPGHPDVLNNLANALKKLKRYDEAERTFRQILQAEPRHVQAHYNLGLLQFERKRYDEARVQFDRALEIDPAFHRAHHQLGLVAESLGRFDEAAARYQRVLREVPGHPQALAALVALRSHPLDEGMLAAAETTALREDLQDPESFSLAFALAKRIEALGDYPRAFRFLKLANERRARRRRYEPRRVDAFFQEYRQTFTREFVRKHAAHGSDSERPVFVIGMPRTGTTLTEQILAAHPDIHGAGELEDMPKVTNRLPMVMQQTLGIGVAPYPACLEHLDPSFMRAMSDYYLEILRRVNADAARVVDKYPFNFLNAGLIALLLPEARLIHCHRDPLDVAISCYTETFDLRHDFTTDLANFAHYYGHYHRLMQHWRETLDASMLEVSYESLVEEPERIARGIVEFCGLPWNDACLQFQQTERPVLTPSRWQVRQPIYRSSIGRWLRYEEHLGPLREALIKEGVPLRS
jgi:tetratricopeptide (TPR) repeat protein